MPLALSAAWEGRDIPSVKELSMPEKKTAIPIADYFVNLRRKKNTKLDAIDLMINWKPVAKKLDKTLKRTANAVGNPAYPAIILFKGLVLQRMYNLSDVELEEQINDRFSFRRFVGLGVSDDVPDATTFCRFRQELLGQKLSEKLFQLVLGQLLKKGDFRQGVSVDATVIESSRRSRTTLEVVPEDRAESDTDQRITISHSDDTEAAWLKKGKRTYYGYKVHMASDPTYGLVVGGHVTPANLSDMNELGQLLSEIPTEIRGRCYADKGYTSKANRDVVHKKGFKDGIMDKAVRGKALTHWQKIRNKCISSVRCGIERIFGTLKQCRDYSRSRYVGQSKVDRNFSLLLYLTT